MVKAQEVLQAIGRIGAREFGEQAQELQTVKRQLPKTRRPSRFEDGCTVRSHPATRCSVARRKSRSKSLPYRIDRRT